MAAALATAVIAVAAARVEHQAGPEHLGRIPADRSIGLVAYRLACPGCGFTTVALPRVFGIAEVGDRVSFARPVTCAACGAAVHVVSQPIQEAHGVRGCCRSR